MTTSGIYKITNIITKKIYIGSASNYKKRKDTHIGLLKQGNHKNLYLQSSFNKYKQESFIFELIEEVDNIDKLTQREQYWMDYYRSYEKGIGYNISKIAGSNLGNKLSDSAKKKIGDHWRGKAKPKSQVDKLKSTNSRKFGKKVSQYDKEMNLLNEYNSISECSRESGLSISAISLQCSLVRGDKRKYKTSKYIFRYTILE